MGIGACDADCGEREEEVGFDSLDGICANVFLIGMSSALNVHGI